MATVQLVGVRPGAAIVQRDNQDPVDVTWSVLHEAQHQDGPLGYVYRWLMHEFCRCEFEERNGRPWQSPRMSVEQIVTNLREQDAQREAEAARAARERREAEERAARMKARTEEELRVLEERHNTPAESAWWPIPSWEVPTNLRFDTPGRNQGQIVEVSYGTFGRAEAGSTDPYMRVVDHSDGSRSTYRRKQES